MLKGQSLVTKTQKNAVQTAEFIQKAMAFESHFNRDSRFHDRCTMITLMLQNEQDISALERILVNAYAMYTMSYFQNKSFNMSRKLAGFMVRYPINLDSDEEAQEYLALYETHCERQIQRRV